MAVRIPHDVVTQAHDVFMEGRWKSDPIAPYAYIAFIKLAEVSHENLTKARVDLKNDKWVSNFVEYVGQDKRAKDEKYDEAIRQQAFISYFKELFQILSRIEGNHKIAFEAQEKRYDQLSIELKSERRAAQIEREFSQKERDSALEERKTAQKERETNARMLTSANTSLGVLNEQLSRTQKELTSANDELAKSNKSLTTVKSQLETEKAEREKDKKDSGKRNDIYFAVTLLLGIAGLVSGVAGITGVVGVLAGGGAITMAVFKFNPFKKKKAPVINSSKIRESVQTVLSAFSKPTPVPRVEPTPSADTTASAAASPDKKADKKAVEQPERPSKKQKNKLDAGKGPNL
jgi:hypothetical protein